MSHSIKDLYLELSLQVARELEHEMIQSFLTDKVKDSNKKKHRRWRAIKKAGKL